MIGKPRLQKTAGASHGVRGEGVTQSAHIEGQQLVLIQAEGRAFDEKLMERVCERANLNRAYRQVVANQGAAGVDKMTTAELFGWLQNNKQKLVDSLINGTYEPKPVKGVKIPKTGGGTRQLGVPAVVDRLVQQAILQVLEPILDPTFSESSFGFRSGRSAHQALRQASQHVASGHNIVVDLDLEKFFDRVNHDILMGRLAKRIADKRVLKIVRRFLTAGMMESGVVTERAEGTPQGGPLSPLLANLLLDDLDRELEKRGHKFCRYADDCNIYVQTKRAGDRVMASVKQFLEGKLKLKVNEKKSAVARTYERKFLGYRILDEGRLAIAPASLERAKNRIHQITSRNRGTSLESVIAELNEFTRGWVEYFKLAEAKRNLLEMDMWIRRRLRCYRLKQCKRLGTIVRFFLSRDVPEHIAKAISPESRWWRASATPAAKMAMPNKWFENLGLFSLEKRYLRLKSY